jgi:geranylgeranyl pyrophosphate synthase
MDDVVSTGDSALLEKRIIAIHRLKTAVPAGTLARLGAVVGGASDVQVDAVGRYFEGVGVSFQIMDDVLNLRGIYAKEADKLKAGGLCGARTDRRLTRMGGCVGTALKTLGEDIRCGKVTFPIAKYMGCVKDLKMRQDMWNTVKSKPQDQAVVDKCIEELERVGAIEMCVVDSIQLVDDAWERLDAVIPESFAMLMLRAFGWYVTSSA